MLKRADIATGAIRGALETRKRADVPFDSPICIYDVAEKLGIETRFFGGSSFGGMYSKEMERILVPSERPAGRQSFTCAHELGHWYFAHGDRIDNDTDFNGNKKNDPEEQIADLYAAFLLMPKRAVLRVFKRRTWTISDASPIQVYTAACQLNVGYETLIRHLQWSLKAVTRTQGESLLKQTPKKTRTELLDGHTSSHLVVVDRRWERIAIDLRVGDMAVLPLGVNIEGASVDKSVDTPSGPTVQAVRPGISRVFDEKEPWAAYIRVARKGYEGRSLFRHMEDPDYDMSSCD